MGIAPSFTIPTSRPSHREQRRDGVELGLKLRKDGRS